jgi:ERCC4-related helicase
VTDLVDLRKELEQIAERLSDLAMERLRMGIEGNLSEPEASAQEKALNRARASVEKARSILEGLESSL